MVNCFRHCTSLCVGLITDEQLQEVSLMTVKTDFSIDVRLAYVPTPQIISAQGIQCRKLEDSFNTCVLNT